MSFDRNQLRALLGDDPQAERLEAVVIAASQDIEKHNMNIVRACPVRDANGASASVMTFMGDGNLESAKKQARQVLTDNHIHSDTVVCSAICESAKQLVLRADPAAEKSKARAWSAKINGKAIGDFEVTAAAPFITKADLLDAVEKRAVRNRKGALPAANPLPALVPPK